MERVGDDDTHAFVEAKLPAISIRWFHGRRCRFLRSTADRLEAVRIEDDYDAYRLVAFFSYLDSKTE